MSLKIFPHFLWLLWISLVIPGGVFALDVPYAAPVEAWAERVFAGGLKPQDIIAGLGAIQADLEKLSGRTKTEALIQIRLTAVQGLLDLERKDLAEQVLGEAEVLSRRLSNPLSPDSRALVVEIRSKMLSVKDVPYIIANAGGVQDEAEAILKTSPANLRARFVAAYGRIYAPALFGGNPDRSRQIFQSILSENLPQKSVRFLAWTGLSEAWRKLGNRTERQASLRQAEALFPGNTGLARLKVLE